MLLLLHSVHAFHVNGIRPAETMRASTRPRPAQMAAERTRARARATS